MIILTKDKGVVIPNYDDLENKPKINGVTLEGDLTIEELGIDWDAAKYYTKTESDDRFQPKGDYQPAGDYLTNVPSEYVTETELNNTLTNKNYATKSEIPTVPSNISSFNNDAGYITENALNGYASENWVTENYQPKGDYQPAGNYLTSIPSEYVTENELNNTLNQKDYATKTYVDNAIENIEDGSVDLTGYATEQWVENKGYLTSIPSEYVTETELNDAIAGLSGSDIPFVIITTESVTSTTLQYTGDLNGVINAVKNKTPYNAYFYNIATYYGVRDALYEVDFVYYDSANDSGKFYVHSEGGGGQHRVNSLPFTFDGENYQLGSISYVAENYATVSQLNNKQDTLVSGTNIKTINGNSILGSGNLTIEGGGTTDLSNYYTKTEIDNKIGDINTILENIIG